MAAAPLRIWGGGAKEVHDTMRRSDSRSPYRMSSSRRISLWVIAAAIGGVLLLSAILAAAGVISRTLTTPSAAQSRLSTVSSTKRISSRSRPTVHFLT